MPTAPPTRRDYAIEYAAWVQMHQRCNNPNHPRYASTGATGAHICERWRDFATFFADVGSRPSSRHRLTRLIDKSGNYEPGNAGWTESRTWKYSTSVRRTPEYEAWCHMKSRCSRKADKAYPDYGGRGITVCDEWLSDFSAFLGHIGYRPGPEYSVDRKDNNRGYEPGNVRWATRTEQSNNRRERRSEKLTQRDGRRSRFKGVAPRCDGKKWLAHFRGKHIGCFDSEVDAAMAYNYVAYAKYGDDGYYNTVQGVVKCQY
jgi:hypothetical protein